MIEIHRHDYASQFDGFGSPYQHAEIAKSLGYEYLGISNHGNTASCVQHYKACKKFDINPILGCEVYIVDCEINDENKQNGRLRKRYHLNLFCKNIEGYQNLNKLLTLAEQQKYYKPILTIQDIKNHKNGLICTTACIGSYCGQKIIQDEPKKAYKFLEILKKIFDVDLYIELQPFPILENAGGIAE